jgi:hypothetical protein
MSTHPRPRRVPRARIDPIACADDALALIRGVLAVPARPETIVVILDDAHRGLGIVSVSDTTSADAVVDVVECLAQPDLFGGDAAALVVATARPLYALDDAVEGDTVGRDIDRWFEICDLAELVGLELVEWFVVGRSISCPRDLVGVPPRWRGGAARSA